MYNEESTPFSSQFIQIQLIYIEQAATTIEEEYEKIWSNAEESVLYPVSYPTMASDYTVLRTGQEMGVSHLQ
jgi:hypothetical protein